MKNKQTTTTVLLNIFLSIGAVISTLPMLYMISTALKPNGALYEFPPHFFPSLDTATLENFRYILQHRGFSLNFLNSIVVSILTVAVAALVASALAFVLARFRFRGKGLLFGFIILTMIIPGTTLIVPQYDLAVQFNLINKLFGLIPFYISWVIPFSTFMIRGFIENIPVEFDEATYMDGGSVYTVYFKIALPLAKPAIASVTIFNFLSAWEEYPWANIVINDDMKRTLPIAISGFFGQHQFTQWGYVFALSILSLIPIMLVFIFVQRYFISGIMTGGVKG
jgi:ABC-type glycerol-3-phosphate transport system permease component